MEQNSEKKVVLVQQIFKAFTDTPYPAACLYEESLDWFMQNGWFLEDDGCLLVEYVNGLRSKSVEIRNGKYVDYV